MKCILRNIILLLLISPAVKAQDFTAILRSIEQHSTSLEAARMESEAEKKESKLINALEDPEVGMGYLWGNNGIGNRVDVEFSQTFDFPTLYAKRKQMAQEQRRVADLKYLNERQQLLLSAKKLCIQVVYCNALMDHLELDLAETRAMADSYEKLFQKGEATIIDKQKAHQAFLFFEAEYREFKTLKNNLMEELQYMNGGEAVVINDTVFTHNPLPKDFNEWMDENLTRYPELQLAQSQIAAQEKAVKVTKGEWLPKLKVGYMSEKEREDHYQGITFGVSVPIWSGARKVKSAKAHLAAAQMMEKDVRNHLATQLRGVYNDALQLQETYQAYHKHLTECDNTPLLQKSLDAGQINLLTYLNERQYVHEMHEKILEAERDLELRKAELCIYE